MTTARPILFSAPMVRALLSGTKTQTRRLVKEPVFMQNCVAHVAAGVHGARPWKCPYGIPGDLLWVRESYYLTDDGYNDIAIFSADDGEAERHLNKVRSIAARYKRSADWMKRHTKHRPGIHMPRWASRLTLEITGVRVERLQDISESDAQAEGISEVHQSWLENSQRTNDWCRRSRLIQKQRGIIRDCADDVGAYSLLWDHINGAGSWDQNPWIVALTFKVHKATVDAVLEQMKVAA